MRKKDVQLLLTHLHDLYPDAACELDFRNPFELLIAVTLSAQTTDKVVNMVTPALFAKYPTAFDLAQANQADVEELLKRIGLFRTKAKNIIAASQLLVELYGGEVPNDHQALVRLPGVGRKTANVVQSVAFGVPAIAVDTHVFRLAQRLNLSKADDVLHVEQDLMKKIPKDEWIFTHHALIYHGRRMCMARNPACPSCPLQQVCSFYKQQSKKKGKI